MRNTFPCIRTHLFCYEHYICSILLINLNHDLLQWLLSTTLYLKPNNRGIQNLSTSSWYVFVGNSIIIHSFIDFHIHPVRLIIEVSLCELVASKPVFWYCILRKACVLLEQHNQRVQRKSKFELASLRSLSLYVILLSCFCFCIIIILTSKLDCDNMMSRNHQATKLL